MAKKAKGNNLIKLEPKVESYYVLRDKSKIDTLYSPSPRTRHISRILPEVTT